MAYTVVDVLRSCGRIATAIKEGMVALENLDEMVANRHGDDIFTLFIGLDNLAVAVFQGCLAIKTEIAVFYGIGGVLVINYALDVEA